MNVGQLLRESIGEAAYLVGLFAHSGTVIAANEWGTRGVSRELRPALPESYSGMFHAAGLRNALLLFRRRSVTIGPAEPLLERAVGVVYRPHTERRSHYFPATMAEQFDAVLFFAETRALEPL